MGIAQLTVCDWSQNPRDLLISQPQWSQIEAAIRALNNDNLNDIYLQPASEPTDTFLGVGGGAGKYLVTGAVRGATFPTLVDDTSDDESLTPLVVGGQLGEFPARWLVSLEAAIAAVRAFYDSGGFDCGVKWAYPQG
jgi:hypothetical protein